MKAVVNRIINNTFIDGPGCRLAVFLQGCNMRCLYCHNPETQKLCNSCGICVGACPAEALIIDNSQVSWDEAKCTECDSCIKVCPSSASPKCKEMYTDELYNEILKWADFLDGVTFSGGECTTQHIFIYELFKKLKSSTRLNCFIDTNGFLEDEAMEKLCEVTDGFMFDIKAYDRNIHIALTGVDNKAVLDNMSIASSKGLLYEVRTVVVKGFTDKEDEIGSICRHIKGLNNYTRFKLIPFRPHGVRGEIREAGMVEETRFEELYRLAQEVLGDRAVK